MCEIINQSTIKMEPFGVIATVPNDDYARLMYYLSCVETVINYDKMNKLSDYENYKSLNSTQKKLLLDLCELMDPKLLIGARIFRVNEDLLLDNNSNQFYKITDQKIGISRNKEIMIGGKTVKILKIMVCKKNWLQEYYFNPIKNIYIKEKMASCLAEALLSSLKLIAYSKLIDEDEKS